MFIREDIFKGQLNFANNIDQSQKKAQKVHRNVEVDRANESNMLTS